MEKVAVMGWAQSDYVEALELDTRQSLTYRVINDALDSAGLSIQDIDIVFSTGSDIMNGAGTSACDMVGALGGHFREESRVAGDALFAVMLAYMRICSGFYNTALVVAYGKDSENKCGRPGREMSDPLFHRPLGIDGLVIGALQEKAYLYHTYLATLRKLHEVLFFHLIIQEALYPALLQQQHLYYKNLETALL